MLLEIGVDTKYMKATKCQNGFYINCLSLGFADYFLRRPLQCNKVCKINISPKQ
jgi:hypothetical protein